MTVQANEMFCNKINAFFVAFYHSCGILLIMDKTTISVNRAAQLVHSIAPFKAVGERIVVSSLRQSHAECPSGMNRGDIGTSHRLSLIKGLPGVVTPYGVVELMPGGENSPVNTSWLKIPTADGDIYAPVNCVRDSKRENVYKLAKGDVEDLADFAPTARLIELDTYGPLDCLVAIKWTLRRDNSSRFLVRFMCGRLDSKRRLFYAEEQSDIASLDTRTGVDGTPIEAAGPTPDLKPRR